VKLARSWSAKPRSGSERAKTASLFRDAVFRGMRLPAVALRPDDDPDRGLRAQAVALRERPHGYFVHPIAAQNFNLCGNFPHSAIPRAITDQLMEVLRNEKRYLSIMLRAMRAEIGPQLQRCHLAATCTPEQTENRR
jgi:hypothetical protein